MKKRIYSKPKIELFVIEIEEALCTGSVITKPQNSSNVSTEWEKGIDQDLVFSWN